MLLAGPASADKDIPIGMYNVNNQVMNSGKYVYAIRFVPYQDQALYRFFSGFNLEGSDFAGGRDGYAQGNGGTIRARLVSVKADGTPNLANVLAEENVPVAQRYAETTAGYGIPDANQLLYFNMGSYRSRPGRSTRWSTPTPRATPRATGSRRTARPSPSRSPVRTGATRSTRTPPARSRASIRARPSPGRATRARPGPGACGRVRRHPGRLRGHSTGDDGTRLPWYGVQTAANSRPTTGQPYYAYRDQGSYTLRADNVPRDVTFTAAGGYGPKDGAIGTVTVKNLRTGETAHTEELGGGLVKGVLDHPLSVNTGDSYEISNTGTVFKQEADSFIDAVFGLGAGGWPFRRRATATTWPSSSRCRIRGSRRSSWPRPRPPRPRRPRRSPAWPPPRPSRSRWSSSTSRTPPRSFAGACA